MVSAEMFARICMEVNSRARGNGNRDRPAKSTVQARWDTVERQAAAHAENGRLCRGRMDDKDKMPNGPEGSSGILS